MPVAGTLLAVAMALGLDPGGADAQATESAFARGQDLESRPYAVEEILAPFATEAPYFLCENGACKTTTRTIRSSTRENAALPVPGSRLYNVKTQRETRGLLDESTGFALSADESAVGTVQVAIHRINHDM